MAEIISNSKKTKGQRMVKKSTRVDLTPMVDLGFLLITFFVFTTTMSQPQVMNIISPIEKEPNTDVCESCVITVIAAKDDRIYYYEGNAATTDFVRTTYAASGLRDVLQKKRQAVLKTRGADECSLIIKPTNEASFGNLVDIIDESKICGIKRYFIDSPDARDIAGSRN